jgi:hypothetical protein
MDDNCGFADVISFSASYLGSASSPPDVNNGSCGTNDGVNEVGFGTQSPNAYTCVWGGGGIYANADIELKLATSGYWFRGAVPGGCSGDFSIENTGTHEFGHALGFGDVSNSLQTMYGTAVSCSRAKTTLACGDWYAAAKKYGGFTPSEC